MNPPVPVEPRDSPWARFGWLLAAVWLVFLAVPIMAIAGSDHPVWVQVIGYVLIALFAGVYLRAFIRFSEQLGTDPDGTFPYVLTMLLLAVACLPILGVNVLTLGPFIVSATAYLMSVAQMWWVGMVTLAVTVAVPALIGEWGSFLFLIGLLLVLLVVNAINTSLIRKGIADEDLRVDYALMAERDRMARDVHDLLGHSLTALSLKAELAERLLEKDPERARAELAQIRGLTAEALDSVRATVGGIRRSGAPEELEIARRSLADASVGLRVAGSPGDIDAQHSSTVAWVLREAVTNVLRHAHASTCWISFSGTSLGVEDDGDGIGSAAGEGHGLRGIRERARMAGAHCEIGGSAHGGTSVRLVWT